MNDLEASWQTDPTGQHDHRYWDGEQWTEHVADAGVASIDPYDATPSESPGIEEPLPVPVSEPEPEPEPVPVPEPAPVPEAFSPLLPAQSPTLGSEPEQPPALEWEPTSDLPWAPASELPPDITSGRPAEPASPGEGASRRALALGGGILAAVAVTVLTFVALGGDDSGTKTTNTSSSTTETTKPKAKPGTYGSDPKLDAEYDACKAGDFASCDLLYLDGPLGSEYRAFGDTCGKRNAPGKLCVTLYPNGDPATSTTTAPTDTTGGN